jgi:hypothetical protein
MIFIYNIGKVTVLFLNIISQLDDIVSQIIIL